MKRTPCKKNEHARYLSVMAAIETARLAYVKELAILFKESQKWTVQYIGEAAMYAGKTFDESLWHFLAFNRANLRRRSVFVRNPRLIYRVKI